MLNSDSSVFNKVNLIIALCRYSWKKDGVLVDFEASRGKIIMLPGVGTITIPRPTASDDGVYQCFAGNPFGVAVSTKISLKAAGRYSLSALCLV